MTLHGEPRDIYSRLMEINQEALSCGHYETAYHILAAAMHYAHDQGDEQRLLAVKETAQAQRDWIDAHNPEHRMATQSVDQRHGQNLYDTLAHQASAQVQIVQMEHRRKNI